jgi:hypothetical protein
MQRDLPDGFHFRYSPLFGVYRMKPMLLAAVENNSGPGPYAELIDQMKNSGALIPQIFHLFRYKPNVGEHLSRLSQEIMRGPSPLSAGQRELIAAFTSVRNQCPF